MEIILTNERTNVERVVFFADPNDVHFWVEFKDGRLSDLVILPRSVLDEIRAMVRDADAPL